MSIDLEVMGQRIRKARRMRQLTAEVLAEQIGIATESLGHIECGNRRPSLVTPFEISEKLDVSLDYLTGRSDAPEVMAVLERTGAGNLTDRQKDALKKMVDSMIPFLKEFV